MTAWHQDLSGYTALITGASSGIGKACALKFAKNKINLLLLARRTAKLQELASHIKQKYEVNCNYIACDVTDRQDIAKLDKQLKDCKIDILINNAGLAIGLDKIQNGMTADWDKMIDTNFKGLLYITKSVLPGMLEKNHGHIVNIGSIAGHDVYPGGAVYCATKHAVNALSKSFRLDILGSNVRITEIAPGLLESEFSLVRYNNDAVKAKTVYEGIQPLLPEDIAETIYFALCAPTHVNINELIVMPTMQASISMTHRDTK